MIITKNLSYTYAPDLPGSSQALENINLHIKKGEFVALIGHTGSGKSTLIQHFNALNIPTSGSVIVDGLDTSVKATPKSQIRKRVGLVFQYPEYQLFEETVYEDIAFGPKNLGLAPDEVRRRVYAACEIMEIKESVMQKSPFDLSGGQKRRVAIAGVLSMEPSVLVLDEPVAGLDPKGREKMLSMLRNLRAQRNNMTIILVSHSMEDIAGAAERIIVMNKGTVSMDGTVSEIFSRGEELNGMGLAVPEITKVCDELRKRGYTLPQHIYTLDDGIKAISDLLSKGGMRNV